MRSTDSSATDTVEVERTRRPPEGWDALVHSIPGATFCHLGSWGVLLSEVMGHEPMYLTARGPSGDIRGVLPLAQHTSWIFGRRLISMPLLNAGGPVGDAPAVRALAAAAKEEAGRRNAMLELRTRTHVEAGLSVCPRKVAVLLELPPDPEQLFGAFSSNLRRKIRKPTKEGLQMRFGVEHIDAFYEVLGRNMRDIGTPVLPRKLFRRVAETFPNEVVFGAVYQGERPLAGGAGFVFAGEFEFTWVSSLREFSNLGPNMLLHWSFMEEMIRRGVQTFNFGRSTPGAGPHQFKLHWGGKDMPLPWLQWPPSESSGRDPGAAAQWVSALWQRIPVSIANRAGPWVAPQLPWW